jgi:hypothetical protein
MFEQGALYTFDGRVDTMLDDIDSEVLNDSSYRK